MHNHVSTNNQFSETTLILMQMGIAQGRILEKL